MDIHNTARVKLEIQNGDGGIFAMVVTGLIAATVDVFLCIMVASMHVMEQVQLMDIQVEMAKHVLRMAQRV